MDQKIPRTVPKKKSASLENTLNTIEIVRATLRLVNA